ncbi:SGF29 tudor-like domain-containing protein [Tribonema minus]|uniref:SGF29 tudor-like domain-containing protein n=1 Tax=Tribonema minus TaxID=303371 RepID=A0A836CJB6_9STRA|nr:SGF29 tudor-like domain-containing protein [Tribonema minus]
MSNTPGGHTPSGIDFNKLTERSLLNYCGHHNIHTSVGLPASKQALAAACARHFRTWQIDEEDVLKAFSDHVSTGFASRELGGAVKFRKRARPGGDATQSSSKAARSPQSTSAGMSAMKPGEKVAARTNPNDDNGSWILASVQRYYANLDKYEVADEDDTSRKFMVDACFVLRLTDNVEGLHKGGAVLAMFPDTTSFYKGKMAKSLKRGMTEALVQFEDDEDETGKTPNRRIDARYVFPVPQANGAMGGL